MIVERPEFDEHVELCGVETGIGSCPETGVARVQIATFEYDHTEWAPYVGQYVMVVVCAEHKTRIEDDHQRAQAGEEERVERREAASERVRELEAQLREAQRERDRI